MSGSPFSGIGWSPAHVAETHSDTNVVADLHGRHLVGKSLRPRTVITLIVSNLEVCLNSAETPEYQRFQATA